ncbi:hypothetical protein K466DRAFT_666772 [Polyporus arcularius HHB13444]|uniref:DUF6533 domain-containing protein n=1 Tax=Polyporus arcularius HHB13444 TaxID=1314778 RepID=A0A5C3NXL9_9APHY|nr:hypothetical protein K466DRAFT_666772 [Polyporus arcularius HHB13444]
MAAVLDGQLGQLSQLRIAVYTDVASLALLAYDWLLTFGDEVNMIWMSKAKLSKLLYLWTLFATFFLVEGLPPAASLSLAALSYANSENSAHRRSTNITIALPTIMWWSVEFVFALRVWILYRRSRKLLMFLTVMYTISITISIVVLVKALSHTQPVFLPHGLPVTGCFSTVPDTIFEAIVTGIVTTSVLCILTIYRILRDRKEVASSPLLALFFRDGLMYYCCVNVVFMCNLFMLRFENAAFKILFNGLLNAVPCMLGARVLINILSLVRTSLGTDATTGSPLSDPKFARDGPPTLSGSDKYSTCHDGGDASTGNTMTTISTVSNHGTLQVGEGIEQVLRLTHDLERGKSLHHSAIGH